MATLAKEDKWWEEAPATEDRWWEEAPPTAPQGPSIPAPFQGGLAGPYTSEMRQMFSRKEEDVDYETGVKDASIRYQYHAADNEEERKALLDSKFGEGNWRRDRFGATVISPEGMARIGQPANRETALDEAGMSRYDIADFGPDAPGVAAGVAAGIATGGIAGPWATLATGLTTAGGKGVQEAGEALAGINLQSPGEVAQEVAAEGVLGGVGEGVYRGILRPTGRILAGHPEGRGKMRLDPRRAVALEEALEMGVTPRPSSVSGNWLLARGEGMLRTIFGDINERKNAAALQRQIRKIKSSAGPETSRLKLGELIKTQIKGARDKFSKDAARVYSHIDDLTNGAPLVSPASIKAKARELAEDIAKTPVKETRAPKVIEGPRGKIKLPGQGKKTTTGGEPFFADRAVLTKLSQIQELPDNMTFAQAQTARHELYRLWESPSMNQDLPGHQARELWKSLGDDIDNIAQVAPEVDDAIRNARDFYREGIRKFDDAFIDRAAMDPRYAGAIEPEFIIDKAFRQKSPSKVIKLMRLLPEETQQKVRRQAMNDILEKTVFKNPDDMFNELFSGGNLQKAIDSYGDETLDAMFGKETIKELRKLSTVLRLMDTHKKFSSGIVAANIALHPLKNLPKIAWLRTMAEFLGNKVGLRYFTTGLRFPKTRAGIDALSRVSTMVTALAADEAE